MSAIEIRNVWKEFGDQIVLEDVSIDIAPRAFLALVGPSGCGKTTFLRMLLSQETPTRGEILFDGRALPREPDPSRGVVFQRYSVFPHLTVLGNVMLGREFGGGGLFARLSGLNRRAAREEAEALLAEVGLAGFEDEPVRRLSAGQKKRAALARLLLLPARVWLLDEPYANLDREGIALVNRLLHDHATRGGAALVTSHGAVTFAGDEPRRIRLHA